MNTDQIFDAGRTFKEHQELVKTYRTGSTYSQNPEENLIQNKESTEDVIKAKQIATSIFTHHYEIAESISKRYSRKQLGWFSWIILKAGILTGSKSVLGKFAERHSDIVYEITAKTVDQTIKDACDKSIYFSPETDIRTIDNWYLNDISNEDAKIIREQLKGRRNLSGSSINSLEEDIENDNVFK